MSGVSPNDGFGFTSANTTAIATGSGTSPDDGFGVSGLGSNGGTTTEVMTISSTILLTRTITSAPSISPSTSSAPSRSLPLGPIIGGLVAALVLIALFIFLLLKYRSSQRTIRFRAEIDPPALMPFGLNIRERSGGYVTVGNGQSSETAVVSSLPMTAAATVPSSQLTPPGPNSIANYASPNTFSKLRGKLDTHTTYVLHPPIRNERIHLATTDSNQGQFQSNLSNDLAMNDMTREKRASHAPTYISNSNETHYQAALTSISTNSGHDSDSAPPAYDSLSSRLSHTNSS